MSKIIFLKGLPASGKSTWAKQYEIENLFVVRLNKDDIREELGNPTWSQAFENKVLELQRQRGIYALTNGMSIIIDDTNFAKKHHIFWLEMAEKLGCEFEEKFFDTPLEECIKRDSGREKPVGETIIRTMYNQHLRPSKIHTDDRFILSQDISLPKCIICDLDGTLALHNGRNPFDFSKISTDKLHFQVKRILDHYNYIGVRILYVSGRGEESRENTEQWLRDNDCWYEKNQQLLMRSDKDFRSDSIIKTEIYEASIKDKYFVEFVLDDRDSVVKSWRDLGLLCLQVYYGDF